MFEIEELCPHCGGPQSTGNMDWHIRIAHADLPPCTARLDSESGLYTCVLRTPHLMGDGKWGVRHVSARGPVGRTVWTDSAYGAMPHTDREVASSDG